MSPPAPERAAAQLDEERIRRLAGDQVFERGARYLTGGRVSPLAKAGDRIRATVIGTEHYGVELRVGKELQWSCDCPAGRNHVFCRHCVAVALALVHSERDESGAGETAAFLTGLDRGALVALLTEEAERDGRLRERLRLRAAVAGSDREAVRRALDAAIHAGDYSDAREWAEHADAALEALEQITLDDAAAVVELSEHVLETLERAAGAVDDSDGHVGRLAERIERIHLRACERAQPHPDGLAERLLRRQLDAELEPSLKPLIHYEQVLGARGLARYEDLASVEWETVPALRPGEMSADARRVRLALVMEGLARRSGDVDRLVEVLRRDLSSPHSFLRIAEELREAGRDDEAIEWAERGLAGFPDAPDHRLTDFLADLHAEAGRHERAVELAWTHFVDQPEGEAYAGLLSRAEGARARADWRDRAHEHLRGGRQHPLADNSDLVRLLVWEGDLDGAWREASEGGCAEELWLTLADRRAAEHPEDAVAAYRRLVSAAVDRKTKHDYLIAVGYIERIGDLLDRLGRGEELGEYVDELRAAHVRKRSLLALLDALPRVAA